MKLKVCRGEGHGSRYDKFDLSPAPGATVLSLLFEARDRYDDSLAFRYSCRGAVCGSCAMLINKVPRLACRTQVEPLLTGDSRTAVHPHPSLPLKEEGTEGRGQTATLSSENGEDSQMGTVPDCGAPSAGDCPHFPSGRSHLVPGLQTPDLKPYPAIEDGERWNPVDEVLVEPLPHLPVLKDLVVDMTRFYRFWQAVRPVLRPATGPRRDMTETGPAVSDRVPSHCERPRAGDSPHFPERESRMQPSAVKELERYTNCILCGACYGACPVCGENAEYLGPAALAQLYRFHIDPREARDGSRLKLADKPEGWWACRFYTNCHTVCPKGVPPNLAIGRARQELKPGIPHPRPLPEGEGMGEGDA